MESKRAGIDISESLDSLLSPLLETLSRVGTNIYLPMRKSDKCLQLVLGLIQHGTTPRWQHSGKEQGIFSLRHYCVFIFTEAIDISIL